MPAIAPRRPVRAQSPAQTGWWRSLTPYAREITLILLVKLALLWLIWWAFFSEPATRHMQLDPVRVEHQLLSPAHESGHAQR